MPNLTDPSVRRDVVTSVALPRTLLVALDEEAQRSQVYSRSALVRQAIQEYLLRRNDPEKTHTS